MKATALHFNIKSSNFKLIQTLSIDSVEYTTTVLHLCHSIQKLIAATYD